MTALIRKIVVFRWAQLVLRVIEGLVAIALLVILSHADVVSAPARWLSLIVSAVDLCASARAAIQMAWAAKAGVELRPVEEHLPALTYNVALLVSYLFIVYSWGIGYSSSLDGEPPPGPDSDRQPSRSLAYWHLLFSSCVLAALHLVGVVPDAGLAILSPGAGAP